MAGRAPRVGVLGLQGDFREHLTILTRLDCQPSVVRTPEDLASIEGLVIPGGESSVMSKLAHDFQLLEPLKAAIRAGLPVYGTCAGLIVLASTIVDGVEGQESLGALDIAVRRNAFGSQSASFETTIEMPVLGEPIVHAVFIRAPLVEAVGPDVTVLGELSGNRVVAVEQGNVIGTAFHPEMADEMRLHRYFLQKIAGR